jgi:hypothetical protein
MGELVVSLVAVVLPPMWLVSLAMIMEWEHFWKVFLFHTLLMVSYISGIVLFVKPNEYGLNVLFCEVVAVMSHLLVGFCLSLYIRFKLINPSK